MGKTRDLFKKIRYEGNFSCKDGHNKGQAKDIKKRWQEYTEELDKNIFMTQITTVSHITNLEPDILGCEVNWALGSITMNKASEDDEIPAELFQILKDDAVKVLHSENSAVPTGMEKVSFYSNPKENHCQRMLKLSQNCTYLAH